MATGCRTLPVIIAILSVSSELTLGTELLDSSFGYAVLVDDECNAEVDGEACSMSMLQIRGRWKLAQLAASEPAGGPTLTAGEYPNSCHMDKGDCSIKNLDGPTLVYPGGDTACINGDDYAFAVTPGDLEKVLYFFQGGGACWEANGDFGKQVVMQCTDSLQEASITSGLTHGVQNRGRDDNPFKSYTIVEPLYCSGDAFMGNTTMVTGGVTYHQKGYVNAKAVLDWSLENFGNELKSFVVGGYSAGSLGVAAWSQELLGKFRYEKAAIIMDSYAGLFPPETQKETIVRWGVCETDLWDASVKTKCKTKDLTIQDVAEEAMGKFPDVPFASVQSKADASQIWFYKGIARSWGMMQYVQIKPSEFYKGTNDVFEEYARKHPNYKLYLVDGSKHCFMDSPDFFTASGLGVEVPAASNSKDAGVELKAWVSKLVNGEPEKSVCLGPIEANGADNIGYCSEAMAAIEAQTSK